MDLTIYIILLAISLIVTIYLFLRTYQLFVGKNRITIAITDYYNDKGYIVCDISRLSVSDRIRYGVPVTVMWIYSYYFGFLRGKIDYVRKVDLEDKSGMEYIKYIEVQVNNKKILSIKEIDSYEF